MSTRSAAASSSAQCDLSGAATLEEYRRRIAAYAEAHPGARVDHRRRLGDGGLPRRHARPASCWTRSSRTGRSILINRDHHGAWVNTRALERAGIDARTPDPADGRIERDARRQPDRHAAGGRHGPGRRSCCRRLTAGRAARRAAAGPGAAALARHHRLAGRAASASTPVWTTRRTPTSPRPRDGSLTARVVGALWWDRTRGLEQIAELRRAPRPRERGGRFCATQRQDHAGRRRRERTAAMLGPYLDGCGCATGNTRHSASSTRGTCAKYVTALDAHGFQVHFHALGDRAVREALDAVEAARAGQRLHGHPPPPGPPAGRPPRRHRRASAQLGATANIQPLWAAHEPQMDELTIPFLGPERGRVAVPVRRAAARRGDPRARAATGRSAAPTRSRASMSRSTASLPDGAGRHPVFLPGAAHRPRARRSPRTRRAART